MIQNASAALYAVNVTALKEPAPYAEAYAAVSPARREKTDRYRKLSDRLQSLGAELLLRYGLKRAGLSPMPGIFETGRYGKPYLPGNELFFNLSHSADWVLCAVSESEIGCDIERIRDIPLRAARRFAEEEYGDIRNSGEEEKLVKFFRYWTLKESFLKATGRGMSLPLGSFRITLGDEPGILQNADARVFYLKEFAVIDGFRAAVCAACPVGDTELIIVQAEELLASAAE